MKPWRLVEFRLILLSIVLSVSACGGGGNGNGVPTPSPDPTPVVRFEEWRGAELGVFALDHAILEDGSVRLPPSGGMDGTDTGNLYNGGSYTFGTLVSPEVAVAAPFREAIVSWEATTPPNTWIEVDLAARIDGNWTKDYILGIWSSGNEAFDRHSVSGQGDADGTVYTDTLSLAAGADAFRLTAKIFAAPGAGTPRLRALAVVTTDDAALPPDLPPLSAAHGVGLDVPTRSQMIYPGGGEVWCSPTSTSMILAWWAQETGNAALSVAVPDAAEATWDAVYNGTGNWPFNTAWAASVGDGALRAFVTRLWRIEQLERLTGAGFPVVVTGSWASGEMTGSPLDSTGGHVFVVRGFDANGDVLVNEPAGADDDSVRHTYDRAQFDAAWSRSGRTTYVIHPVDLPLPQDGALGAW